MKRTVIIGAGPAGLSCALKLKRLDEKAEIFVIEKATSIGRHNLSGGILSLEKIESFLDSYIPGWTNNPEILKRKILKDDMLLFLDKRRRLVLNSVFATARKFGLGTSSNLQNAVISISSICRAMAHEARKMGIGIITSCPIAEIEMMNDKVTIRSIRQGLDHFGREQDNYLPPEEICADFVVLAEGAAGAVTEKFIEKYELRRSKPQLFSLGIKEIVKVPEEHYVSFGKGRVVHVLGYPLWRPVLGPDIFGGGILYDYGENRLSVGMIAALDWKYCNFSAQDALTLFKQHTYIERFLKGGEVIEAGARMIPEGGFYSIPKERISGTIGKDNVLICGDGAGFVNMLDVKGLHNAILSGAIAAEAIATSSGEVKSAAMHYTCGVKKSSIWKELYKARRFRQTVAKYGMTFGMPLAILPLGLPVPEIHPDRMSLTDDVFPLLPDKKYDRDHFTAMANITYREQQPAHISIRDNSICDDLCRKVFKCPCLTFCPGGVYDRVDGKVTVLQPSNCLNCRTCANKCPFDNINLSLPEGGSGPNYKNM